MRFVALIQVPEKFVSKLVICLQQVKKRPFSWVFWGGVGAGSFFFVQNDVDQEL